MHKLFYSLRLFTLCLTTFYAASSPNSAWSVTYTWQGTTSSDLSNGANWTPAGGPPGGGVDTGQFNSTATNLFPTLQTLISPGNLILVSGPGTTPTFNIAVSTNNGEINIGGTGGITNTSGVAQNFFIYNQGTIDFAPGTTPSSSSPVNLNCGTLVGGGASTGGVLNFETSNYTDPNFTNVNLANGSSVILSGGTVSIASLNIDINSPINGTNPLNAALNAALIVNSTGILDGAIAGTGSLTKAGTGVLKLTNPGNGNIASGITISGGTLTASPATALQSQTTGIVDNSVLELDGPGTIVANISGSGAVNINATAGSGTTVILNGAHTYTGATTLSSGILQIGATGALNSAISGAGGLTSATAGILQLTQAVSYTGPTQVNTGSTLELDSFTTFSSATTLQSGSTIDYNLPAATTGTVSGLISGLGGVQINNGTPVGSGTIIFSNPGNSYSGGTVINAGRLVGILSPTPSVPGNVNVANGSTFELDGPGTFPGIISGPTGNFAINTTSGAGTTVILTGPNTYGGTTTISSGKLQGTTLTIPSNPVTDNGILDLEQAVNTTGTFSGAITGTTGAVNINGAGIGADTGTVILSSTGNTYGGGTTIGAGTLQGMTTTIPGNVTISTNAVFDLEQPTVGSPGTFNGLITGGGALKVNANGANTGTIILTNTLNAYTGGTTIANGTLQGVVAAIPGNVIDNAIFDLEQGPSTTATFAGVISGTGIVNINTVAGNTGTVIFSNLSNSYAGPTTISAGTLQGLVGAIPGNVVDNATLDLEQPTGSGTFAGSITQTTGSGKLTINAAGGIGTVILTNPANNYSGGTTIAGGTLQGSSTTIPGNVVDNGTLDLEQAASTTGIFAGSITQTTGSGKLTINAGGVPGNTGTIVLTNPGNTYGGGTTIAAGTLQVNNLGAIPGSPGFGIIDNGTMDFELTASGTYMGPISGLGALIVGETPGNVLTLNQPATYTGLTTLKSGTLELDNQTAFVSNVALASGSTIDFNQFIVTPATVSGQITGGGAVQINGNSGTGKVILSSTGSTYTGGTTIFAGTLQTNTNLPGSILDNGILDLEQTANTTGTLNGLISGTGSVSINGAGGTGTVILGNAANSYTGGTTVANGTLKVNNLKGVPGNITIQTPGTLTFNQTINGTFNNQVLGTGTISKIGSKKLTFGVNESAFNGTTIVNEGSLVVNHSLGGNVIVQGTGILSGTGRILGNLTLKGFGTIAPGNIGNLGAVLNGSVGTFHVNGNFAQSGASVYQVQAYVDPNLTLHSSLIDVGGITRLAIVGAESVNVNLTGITTQLPVGTSLTSTILHSDGGVIGRYKFTVDNFPLVTSVLTYDAHNVFLNLTNTLAFIPVTPNQTQVGIQLQSITDPTAIEEEILVGLTSLPKAQALAVLDEMSGEQYTSTLLTAEFASRDFIRRLYDPLRLIINTPYCATKCCCNEEELGLDTWAEISGHQTFLRQGYNAHSVRVSGYEVSVGAQMTFNSNLTIGTAYSYQMDHLHYHVGGSGKSNINLGGIYGLYRPCDYYVLGDFIFGYSHDKINRHIFINDALDFHPHSKPRVFQTGYYVEAGKDFYWRFLLVQPFIGLEGGHFRFNQIVETGGAPLNLTIAKKSITPNYARLGIHLNTRNRPCNWSFGLDLAWQYRLNSPGTNILEQFQSFGTPFTIKGQHLSKSFFEANISCAFQLCDNWELYAEVDTETWSNAMSYTVVGGINANW